MRRHQRTADSILARAKSADDAGLQSMIGELRSELMTPGASSVTGFGRHSATRLLADMEAIGIERRDGADAEDIGLRSSAIGVASVESGHLDDPDNASTLKRDAHLQVHAGQDLLGRAKALMEASMVIDQKLLDTKQYPEGLPARDDLERERKQMMDLSKNMLDSVKAVDEKTGRQHQQTKDYIAGLPPDAG